MLRSIETISAQEARSGGRTRMRTRTQVRTSDVIEGALSRRSNELIEEGISATAEDPIITREELYISYIHIYIMGGTNRGVPHREQEY